MTLDDVLARLQLSQTESALMIRQVRGDCVMACAALVKPNMDVELVLVPMGPHLESLREAVRLTGAIAFVFVYDGYLSEACLACNRDGRNESGCPDCRNGRVNSREAIHTVTVTKDGGFRVASCPYRMDGPLLVRLPYIDAPGVAIEGYSDVFRTVNRDVALLERCISSRDN